MQRTLMPHILRPVRLAKQKSIKATSIANDALTRPVIYAPCAERHKTRLRLGAVSKASDFRLNDPSALDDHDQA